MKGAIYSIGLFLIIGVFMLGCSQEKIQENLVVEENQPLEETQGNNQDTGDLNDERIITNEQEISSIDELLLDLESDFELGEKEETLYQLIGAYDGTKIDVDGTKIEIYQYKDTQKDAMESALETAGTIDNQIFIVKENFLILVHSSDTDFSNKLKQSIN